MELNKKVGTDKKVKMKTIKVGLTLFLIFTFLCCSSQKAEWQGSIEEVDGVMVVKNPKEPMYEGKLFTLEEEFSIDTERDEIASFGLTDIMHFDVDSNGNIYCLNEMSNEKFIVKFNKNSNFIISFGRKGQGPGDMNRPYHLELNHQEQIVVTDYLARKLLFFDNEGSYLKELAGDLMAMRAHPLSN